MDALGFGRGKTVRRALRPTASRRARVLHVEARRERRRAIALSAALGPRPHSVETCVRRCAHAPQSYSREGRQDAVGPRSRPQRARGPCWACGLAGSGTSASRCGGLSVVSSGPLDGLGYRASPIVACEREPHLIDGRGWDESHSKIQVTPTLLAHLRCPVLLLISALSAKMDADTDPGAYMNAAGWAPRCSVGESADRRA